MTPESHLSQSDAMQLDVFGGEVKHPPPKPKIHCPACGRLVTLHRGGVLGKHNDHPARFSPECEMSGRVIPR